MPRFDPQDQPGRFRECFRQVNTPTPLDTAIAVVNPDGTTISGGGGGGTVNQGTPNTDANAWPVRITDGTHDAQVTAAGALKVDASATTQPISGSVNQGNQGTIGQSWFVELTNGVNPVGTLAVPLRVDPTGTTTQPVSGTVTTNIGTTGGLALDATLTSGNQKTEVVDGTGNVVGPNQTVSGTNYFPVVLAASGTPGTAPPTRAVQIAGSDGTNLRTLKTETDGTVVVDGSGHTQPVSGTVTANAGTGTFTVGQATGTNLHTVIDSGTVTITTGDRPTTSTSFQTSVTTTEAALATNTAKSISIKAPKANTDKVYLGTTGVTSSTGYLLEPGDAVGMDITNSNIIHAVSASGTQTLTVLVLN